MASELLLLLLLPLCFFFLWRSLFDRNPVLRNWPVVGMLPSLLANTARIHDWYTEVLRACGGTVPFKGPWLSGLDMLVTSDPANVSYITSTTHAAKYPKGEEYREIFDILGDGILNADADSWRIQRKWAHMLMRQRRFRLYVDRTSRAKVGSALLPLLDRAARDGHALDLQEVMQRFTFDATCILVCGVDPGCLSPKFPVVPFAKAVDDAKEVILLRHTVPRTWWRLMKLLRLGNEKLLAEASDTVDCCIAEYVSARRNELLEAKAKKNNPDEQKEEEKEEEEEEEEEAVDLLTSYMDHEAEEAMEKLKSDKFLRDVILNMLVAGRDTTSSALTWFFWELSRNPHVESKIMDELTRTKSRYPKSPNRVFESEELNGLPYLHAALCECLRLYPSVPIVHKSAVEADTLPSGHRVEPGMKLYYCLYAMARMEAIWGEDCNEFKPERWVSEGGTRRDHNDKFFSFNAGPRSCLGKGISFTHMKMVAASTLYNFHVQVVPGQTVCPRTSVILHMKNGLLVKLKRRCN
ncbi:hypothetical protein H6P81_011200 [Aristolochia fimbriata]|uniref:Cytochrome P450 n=1 Tax=Aristolochia fimbriata TaxID=158543 RepID=A0AAV7EQU4_ARIFI|nr:hypothetical protein H6P81_011200 [Aristolochia fimbriata]